VVTQADSAALDVLEGDKKDVADTFKSLQTLPVKTALSKPYDPKLIQKLSQQLVSKCALEPTKKGRIPLHKLYHRRKQSA